MDLPEVDRHQPRNKTPSIIGGCGVCYVHMDAICRCSKLASDREIEELFKELLGCSVRITVQERLNELGVLAKTAHCWFIPSAVKDQLSLLADGTDWHGYVGWYKTKRAIKLHRLQTVLHRKTNSIITLAMLANEILFSFACVCLSACRAKTENY